MEALLLAAGLGTRLRPLTNNIPKALVPIGNRTLLEINIKNLIRQGCRHIIVNIHHYGDKIIDFINSHTWEADIEISDERNLLLDTGGAVKKAAALMLDNTLLVYNVDILSIIDFETFYRTHGKKGNAATLAVSHRSTDRMLLSDSNGRLKGWHSESRDITQWVDNPTTDVTPFAFSGIAFLSKAFINGLPPADKPYPIIPEYLRLAETLPVGLFEHPAGQWLDVGKPETLAKAADFISKNNL